MTEHPMQAIIVDENGVHRFSANAICRYLIDKGSLNLNDIAGREFPPEDRRQFAQLIGYSLSGYSELSYVDDISYETACLKAQDGKSDSECRAEAAEKLLAEVREGMRKGVAALYEKHPDDLRNDE